MVKRTKEARERKIYRSLNENKKSLRGDDL